MRTSRIASRTRRLPEAEHKPKDTSTWTLACISLFCGSRVWAASWPLDKGKPGSASGEQACSAQARWMKAATNTTVGTSGKSLATLLSMFNASDMSSKAFGSPNAESKMGCRVKMPALTSWRLGGVNCGTGDCGDQGASRVPDGVARSTIAIVGGMDLLASVGCAAHGALGASGHLRWQPADAGSTLAFGGLGGVLSPSTLSSRAPLGSGDTRIPSADGGEVLHCTAASTKRACFGDGQQKPKSSSSSTSRLMTGVRFARLVVADAAPTETPWSAAASPAACLLRMRRERRVATSPGSGPERWFTIAKPFLTSFLKSYDRMPSARASPTVFAWRYTA
mmetsp:Transcript_15366/g.42125  ORF Transcript_15366/g.42125 Transcript_15366/m.42125 type:complete len:337 (-) Transcript_15366:190-1200(-)